MMPVTPRARARGVLHRNEPMSRHTTWRTGGPADEFFIPAEVEDLAQFLAALEDRPPVTWVGLGSNLLVRDGGVRGTVVLATGLKEFRPLEGHRFFAQAGVPSARLARAAVDSGLGGAEFLAGIPGTVGGALAMNAGAFGGETWGLVEQVECIGRSGTRVVRRPEEFEIGYRRARGPADEWFVSAVFRLAPAPVAEGQRKIRELLARRGASQPTKQANAGSVFRNPPGDHAARLIETAGLKGARIGGAVVSAVHANFIVNEGTARSADIEALIEYVQERVYATHHVALEPEVQIIGDR